MSIKKHPIIWVEGLIGAGKSTLVKSLHEHLKLRPLYEPVEENKYLSLFYEDPGRWAFSMQVELLQRRITMHNLAIDEALYGQEYKGAVLDRGLPGDRVFCKLLWKSGLIHDFEWETYQCLYGTAVSRNLVTPSLLLYLDVTPEKAFERINKRGRSAESSITLDYLKSLRDGYEDLMEELETGEHAWSGRVKVVRVPWDEDHQPIDPILETVRLAQEGA